MNLINIFINAILVENIVLTKFLGICPFLGSSKKEKDAIYMGISVMLVVSLSSIVTYFIYNYILIPLNQEYLANIMFIFVIASFVQILNIIIKNKFPKIKDTLGIYLPLITTNCAVLGIVLINTGSSYSFIEMLVYSVGSSLGFTLLLYLFSTIQEELDKKTVKKHIKGTPLSLITLSIMAILFSRFLGN